METMVRSETGQTWLELPVEQSNCYGRGRKARTNDLFARQETAKAESQGGGINSYGNRIRQQKRDRRHPRTRGSDDLCRDRTSHRPPDYLLLVLIFNLIRHHPLPFFGGVRQRNGHATAVSPGHVAPAAASRTHRFLLLDLSRWHVLGIALTHVIMLE